MIDLKNQKWYSIQAVGARALNCEAIKKLFKKIKKSFKKLQKMLDKMIWLVVWYTSCTRESAMARTEVRFQKIKNGIRKKWDFIWQYANER